MSFCPCCCSVNSNPLRWAMSPWAFISLCPKLYLSFFSAAKTSIGQVSSESMPQPAVRCAQRASRTLPSRNTSTTAIWGEKIRVRGSPKAISSPCSVSSSPSSCLLHLSSRHPAPPPPSPISLLFSAHSHLSSFTITSVSFTISLTSVIISLVTSSLCLYFSVSPCRLHSTPYINFTFTT